MAAAKEDKKTPSTSSAKVRVAGAWSGVLEVDLDSWTLAMLREELAQRSGSSPDCLNLICAGKVLKDGADATPLSRLGFKSNAKVLATVVSADRGKEINEQASLAAKDNEHYMRLARLKDAAQVLAARHVDGSFPLEDYNIELENQHGQKVSFITESDKKAVVMGLMLHKNAKNIINKQKYKEALDVLYMAEEAFSLCDQNFIETIDNVPMLQLDIVWCYFMLRDISCLRVAGTRLEKARKGFERSHGKDSSRFRLLQAAHQADTAIYLRLELLEGVVSYHSGNMKEARKALSSAQARYVQLQVSDEALSLLMSMGYGEKAAKRAIKMTGQDIESAVEFLVEERAKKIRRKQENLQRQAEILEQKRYGKTPKNKAVDLERLKELVFIGFERELAAEALRVYENDVQQALDHLTDPEKNSVLQIQLEARKKKTQRQESVNQSSVNDAAQRSQTNDAASTVLPGIASGSNSQQPHNVEQTHDEGDLPHEEGELPHDEGDLQADSATADDPGAADDLVDEMVEEGSDKCNRDEEMEGEIASNLTGDALADYDIEVSKEGEAIAEYLALLDAAVSAS